MTYLLTYVTCTFVQSVEKEDVANQLVVRHVLSHITSARKNKYLGFSLDRTLSNVNSYLK